MRLLPVIWLNKITNLIAIHSRFRRIKNVEFFHNIFWYTFLPTPMKISPVLILASCKSIKCLVAPKLISPLVDIHYPSSSRYLSARYIGEHLLWQKFYMGEQKQNFRVEFDIIENAVSIRHFSPSLRAALISKNLHIEATIKN